MGDSALVASSITARNLRQIAPLAMPDVKPAPVSAEKPRLLWVEPVRLCVEERYQRNLSDRSVRLIRKIVAGWSWAKFKPPICVEDEDGLLLVIDGQHTAIAAASHPDVGNIPVLLLDNITADARAAAFIAHNIDRVAVTAPQIYFARLAADDPVAVAADKACQLSGASVRKFVPPGGAWKVGETMAVNALLDVARIKGSAGAARLMKILVDAGRAPILAVEIRALQTIIFNPITRGAYDGFDFVTLIRSKSTQEWQAEADQFRRSNNMPQFQALSRIWKERLNG